MTGKELHEILTRTGISFTDISARLGTSSQNLSNKLRVADVSTGLIERLCAALDMDITDFFPSRRFASIERAVVGNQNSNVNNSTDASLLRILEQQSQQLTTAQGHTTTAQKQVSELIEILKQK